jgi:hypothetical protein
MLRRPSTARYMVVTSCNTMQPTYLSFCHKISSNQKTQLSKNLEEKKNTKEDNKKRKTEQEKRNKKERSK